MQRPPLTPPRCAELLVDALPGWPSAVHDPFGLEPGLLPAAAAQPPPEPVAPPPEAMIRRRAESERFMRIQAEDDLRAEAV